MKNKPQKKALELQSASCSLRLLGASNEKMQRLKTKELVDGSIARKLEKAGRFYLSLATIIDIRGAVN